MSQKLENLLNLALDADQGERERSEELDVGYDKEENVWEPVSYTHLLYLKSGCGNVPPKV